MLKLLVIFICLISTIHSQRYDPDWESLDSRPLPDWYDHSKIGIFIHWGLYSVPSYINEWFWLSWKSHNSTGHIEYMEKNFKPGFSYQEFGPMFTAEFFNPDRWADIFQRSGAKYVVLTSKHHEGYSLWKNSYGFNWNSVDLGPHRDLVGDLATAIKKTDMHWGLYYSLLEWYHPMYEADKATNWTTRDFAVQKSMPALKELVELYEPEVVWGDGEKEAPDKYWGSEEFLAWLYNDSPVASTVVVNDRWGSNTRWEHGGFYNGNDRYNPGVLLPHKWENAFTIDKPAWNYRREAKLEDFYTPEELINEIVVTVACGGNALVNVGPTKEGTIPIIIEERLTQMGDWLGVNGEAIYNSIPWTYQNDTVTPDVWYTSNAEKSKIYAISTKWPGSELILGVMANFTLPGNTFIEMLGSEGRLEWSKDTTGEVTIQVPRSDWNKSKWTWTFVLNLEE